MIGRLFGLGSAPAPALPAELGPLGVPVGGALEIDTLSLRADLADAATAMPVPDGGTMIVAAYGEARLDATTVLSRYYDRDDAILQVMSATGRPGDDAFDVSLYQPWDSVVPANAREWDAWRGPQGRVGGPTFDADGILFNRFWGEGEGHADLVEFVEDIDDGRVRRAIHQSCMLYARPIGRGREMLLINIERDLGDGSHRQGASVEFIVGYGLAPGDVRRI